jgi:hydrogenase-4 membrane subunit HyfE
MGALEMETARAVLDTLAVLLLVTAVASLLVHQLDTAIYLLAGQGLLLAGEAATVALASGTGHGYAAVALTVAAKVLIVPGVLLFVLSEVRLKREVELVLPRRFTLLLGIALVLVAYYVTEPLALPAAFVTRNALPTAVSLLLLGLFLMLIRKKTLSQVLGLVIMENGLYLLAVLATQGLPLAVELGVTIDLIVGVLVMGLVSRQIHRTFDTINTDQLRTLRG